MEKRQFLIFDSETDETYATLLLEEPLLQPQFYNSLEKFTQSLAENLGRAVTYSEVDLIVLDETQSAQPKVSRATDES